MEKCWHAVYTKPRWEKKVHSLLVNKGFEAYCPLTKVRKKWTDRYKIIEVPLFRSYVFVAVAKEEQTRIRLTDGVVNFVYWMGRPAVIKQEEIEVIQKFLKEYKEVEACPVTFEAGQRVRIKNGLLIDNEGLIVKVQNKRAYVLLKTLGYALTAQFETINLETV